jgi:hypothetical protein
MLLLLFYWLGFYSLHSLLAANWLKKAVIGSRAWLARLYRIFYNLISVGVSLLVCRYQAQLPAHQLFHSPALVVAVGYGLLLAGAAVAVWALLGYGLGEFVGWRYLRHGPLRLIRRCAPGGSTPGCAIRFTPAWC